MATYNSPDYGNITIPDNLPSGYTVATPEHYSLNFKELNPQLIDNGNGTYTNPYSTNNAGYSDAVLYRAQWLGITPDEAAADLGESRLSTPIDTWDPDRRRTGGGFDDFLSSYGWMLPAAIIGAGAASGALGAGAAGAEAGAGIGAAEAGGAAAGTNALDAYMASAGLDAGTFGGIAEAGAVPVSNIAANTAPNALDSYMASANLNPGTFSGSVFSAPVPGTVATTAEAQAAADAANAAMKSSVSLSDINNARKLAQALTSKSGSQLIGSQLNSAAQNLATGQTGVGSAIPALIRGNQNPFLQTAQQPIRNTSPDLAQLANLLKQG